MHFDTKLINKIVELPINYLYQTWKSILGKLSQEKREKSLEVLKEMIPVIEKLGGAKLIEETAISVYQVSEWW